MANTPTFSAQHPQVIQPNVVNEQPQHITSLWGQVFPSLVQGASGLKSLIEGNPEIEFQKSNLASQEADNALKYILGANDPALRQQLMDAKIAQFEQSGNTAGAAMLRKAKESGGFNMDLEQQAQNKQFGKLNSAVDASEQLRNPQTPGVVDNSQPPGPNLPQNPTQGQQSQNPWYSTQQPQFDGKTPTPGADTISQASTNDAASIAQPGASGAAQSSTEDAAAASQAPPGQFSPTQAAMSPTGDGQQPVHPLIQKAYAVAAQLGTTPDKLNVSPQTGISPSLDLVAEGRAPVSAIMPMPLPGTIDPAHAQAIQQLAQTHTVPKLNNIIGDYAAANAYGNFVKGRPLDYKDVFAMNLTEAQAKTVMQEAAYQMGGAGNPELNNPMKAIALADLMADPSTAMTKLNGSGAQVYKDALAAYMNAPPGQQIHANTVVQGLVGNIDNNIKLTTMAQAQKIKSAQEQIKATTDLMKVQEETRHHQVDEKLQGAKIPIEQQNANTNKTKAETESRVASSRVFLNQAQQQRLQAEVQQIGSNMANKNVAAALKGMGYQGTGGDEIKNLNLGAVATQNVVSKSELELARLDKEIGLAQRAKPTTLFTTGGLSSQMPAGTDAHLEQLQTQRTAVATELEQARKIRDQQNSDYLTAIKKQSQGMPRPSVFVESALQDPSNWEGNHHLISPSFRNNLEKMYRNSDKLPRGITSAQFFTNTAKADPSLRPQELHKLWDAYTIYSGGK